VKERDFLVLTAQGKARRLAEQIIPSLADKLGLQGAMAKELTLR